MTRQETSLGAEASEREKWPKIEGPIGNYGEDWGNVLVPLRQHFTVDQEDSSSSSTTDLFADSLSDSSSGGPSDAARPTIGAESSRLRVVMTWGSTTRGGKKKTVIVRCNVP